MSESANDTAKRQSKPTKPAADQRMLAHVDKWMAVIREISHEQSSHA